MVKSQIQQPKGHIFLIVHEDNNSDLTASLAHNFTEVKVPKLGIDIVAKLSSALTIFKYCQLAACWTMDSS